MKVSFGRTLAVAALLMIVPATFAAPCTEPVFTNLVNIQGPDQFQTGLAFADFNNDGHLDVIFPNDHNATVSLSLGDGAGGFSTTTDFTVYDHPWGATAADYNHDGNMDFAVTSPAAGYVVIRHGDGAGGFGPVNPYFVGGWNVYVESGDLNGDGFADLVSAQSFSTLVAVLLNDGTGSFGPPSYVDVGGNARGFAIGDLNSDGDLDLATGNWEQGTVSVVLGNGSGGFGAPTIIVSGSNTYDVAIGNFNGDSNPDLASTNRSSDNVTIFLGDGSGSFTLSSTTSTPSHPYGIAVADLNNDGTDDVIPIANDSNELRVYLGDGAGNLSAIPSLFMDYNSNVVAVADLNDDGYIDFGTANNGGFNNQVRIFMGGCNTPPDTTPPTIDIVQPTNASYLLGQAVTVSFSCSDAESGVATCVGSAANGSALNTSVAGSYSFTVNSTDVAGNSAQEVVHYSVGYGIVAMYDQTKAHKAGSTVPIKIKLVDANGNNVSSASIVVHATSVVQISTQASTTLDDAGNANPDLDFRYDASLGGYVFNLKTTGYTTGSYVLNFVAGGGPTVYSVGLQVRQ